MKLWENSEEDCEEPPNHSRRAILVKGYTKIHELLKNLKKLKKILAFCFYLWYTG